MRASPHLTFAGDCATAFRFYEQALGGKIVSLLTYGDTAMAGQVPPEWRGKIVHASLKAGDLTLAGADLSPQQYQRPQGFFVLLEVPDTAEAERVFQALAEKGYVQLALQKTFWSPAFGVLVDQFGIPWEVSCTPERRP
jgi:PhnB protein